MPTDQAATPFERSPRVAEMKLDVRRQLVLDHDARQIGCRAIEIAHACRRSFARLDRIGESVTARIAARHRRGEWSELRRP